MFVTISCLLILMGLVQVVRPQLLWGMNKRLQRGWVRNPDATEPTSKGYAYKRAMGVVFLVAAGWILATHL